MQICPGPGPQMTASKAVQEMRPRMTNTDPVQRTKAAAMHILLQERPASSRLWSNTSTSLSRLLRRTMAPCWKEIRRTAPDAKNQKSLWRREMLAMLYSCMGGVAPRPEQEVLQAMSTPIRRRKEYVNAIASSRGVSQLAEEGSVRTHADWLHWYAEHPLSEDNMDAAVRQWKQHFPMKHHTLGNITYLEKKGTKDTKKSERPSQRCLCGIPSAGVHR